MKKLESETPTALEATVEFWYDRDHLIEHLSEMPIAGMLDLEGPAEQKMRLRVTQSIWEVELIGRTIFGSGTTLVRHRDGRAELFHHGTKTRFEIAAKDMPAAQVARSGRWHVNETAARYKGESSDDTFLVTLHDPLSDRRWVQNIRCEAHPASPRLSREFAEALLGGGHLHESSRYPLDEVLALVGRHGLPVEVTLHPDSPKTSPISRFRVTDILLTSESPKHRKPMRDYGDLRKRSVRKAWSRPGPGLREIPMRDLEEILQSDDGSPQGAEVRMLGRDDDVDRERPERPTRGDYSLPTTLTTGAAQIAMRIEQRLLDDAQRTFNAIAAHLRGVNTVGVFVTVPWLEDIVASARVLDPIDENGNRHDDVPGTALAALLHEDTRMPNLKTCKAGGGKGIIDQKAAKKARKDLVSGQISPFISGALSSADLKEVNDALANTDPNARFAMLSARAAAGLIAAVAFEDIGSMRFSVGELQTPINIKDLYSVWLTDFSTSLGFPSATMSTTDPPAPLEAPLVSGLRCRSNGTIDGVISIGGLSVDATIYRKPLPIYWVLLVGGAPAIAVFFPQFAWVIPLLWAFTIFFATDDARVRLEARPLSALFTISFRAGANNAALRPEVSVRLVGSVRTRMLSYFPDGLHQIIDSTLAEFTNLFGITLGILQGQLGEQISSMLRTLMGDGVPGSIMRLGVPVASGSAAGEDDKYVYLESTFDTPSDPSIRITPVSVSAALRWDLARDIEQAFGPNGTAGRGRHYLSLASSINAINQVAATLWKRHAYDAFIPDSSVSPLRPLLTPPFTGTIARVDTWHEVPPTFAFPPTGPSGAWHFADVVFPSFIVQVNRHLNDYWLFRYMITCRAVFGLGTVPEDRAFLSLTGIQPNIYEALFDPASVTAVLLEATEVGKTTITVQDSGDDPRHPEAIHTHHEVIDVTTDRTAGAPASWTQFGRGIFVLANWWRHPRILPRLDGLKSDGHTSTWPLDGITQHTYDADGVDPDNAQATIQGITIPGNAHLPVDWRFLQGLSFAHFEAAGAIAAVLSGTSHINSFATFEAEALLKIVGDWFK